MTLDEAIRHCEEVAWENDRKAMCVEEAYQTTEQQNCEQCAADHRQLAEWLTELKELRCKVFADDPLIETTIEMLDTELKEAKRLLKAAVDDMRDVANNGTCNHCVLDGLYAQGGCCTDGCYKWRYADEALKLIGDEPNGI